MVGMIAREKYMADYVIELVQLARLLTPPLENQQFLDLAIQHFPQDVRYAMNVAKPSNFGEAVTLLKQLQRRKAAEKGSEVNLGIYNNNLRNLNKNNRSSSSGVNRPVECPPSLVEEPGSFSQEQSSGRYQNNQGNYNSNDQTWQVQDNWRNDNNAPRGYQNGRIDAHRGRGNFQNNRMNNS